MYLAKPKAIVKLSSTTLLMYVASLVTCISLFINMFDHIIDVKFQESKLNEQKVVSSWWLRNG
jgi:hypothetical protein